MDATDDTQDTPQVKSGKAPGQKQPTSDSKEKTYTEAEVQKAVSDGKAALGREKAELTKANELLTAKVTKLTQGNTDLTQRVETIELDGIRGDPQKLSAYQQRKVIQERESALEAREADVAAKETQAQADAATAAKEQRAGKIQSLATTYELEPKVLEDLNIEDPGQLESVAKALSEAKTGKPAQKTITKVDSGRHAGGTSTDGMSPLQKIKEGLRDKKKT